MGLGNTERLPMTHRPQDVREFLDACLAAFGDRVSDPRATASLKRIGAALETPGKVSSGDGAPLPV